MKKFPNSGSGSAFGAEASRKTDEPLQLPPGNESSRWADTRFQSGSTERRSPHRVISTASYYHPERRRRLIGEGPDGFPEGSDAEDETDGDNSFS
jgi:hypothetical protein